MPVISDLTIPSVRYATELEDYICAKSVDLVTEIITVFYAEAAAEAGLDLPAFEDVECVGYDTGVLPEMRDAVINYLEECGFAVRPDGADF